MVFYKNKLVLASGLLALLLTGCQSGNEAKDQDKADAPAEETAKNTDGNEHNMDMMHGGSGEIPAGLQEAKDPKFPVGSKAVMHADHMPGMNGVEATISGAFATTAYAVTYTPTTGGEQVKNHKWVIHEELVDPGSVPLQPGTKVKLKADHMEGMDGAEATIDSAEQTTVYMVDFTPEDGGEEVKNHKWVTEDELSAE